MCDIWFENLWTRQIRIDEFLINLILKCAVSCNKTKLNGVYTEYTMFNVNVKYSYTEEKNNFFWILLRDANIS